MCNFEVCQTRACFLERIIYSSVPQAVQKTLIWHIQNCNILTRKLQVTENSQNNEGGVIDKCSSENAALAAEGYQNLTWRDRVMHPRLMYRAPLPTVSFKCVWNGRCKVLRWPDQTLHLLMQTFRIKPMFLSFRARAERLKTTCGVCLHVRRCRK